jgi:hypothetical protein
MNPLDFLLGKTQFSRSVTGFTPTSEGKQSLPGGGYPEFP